MKVWIKSLEARGGLKNELIVDANVRVTKDVLLKLSSLVYKCKRKENRLLANTGFLVE